MADGSVPNYMEQLFKIFSQSSSDTMKSLSEEQKEKTKGELEKYLLQKKSDLESSASKDYEQRAKDLASSLSDDNIKYNAKVSATGTDISQAPPDIMGRAGADVSRLNKSYKDIVAPVSNEADSLLAAHEFLDHPNAYDQTAFNVLKARMLAGPGGSKAVATIAKAMGAPMDSFGGDVDKAANWVFGHADKTIQGPQLNEARNTVMKFQDQLEPRVKDAISQYQGQSAGANAMRATGQLDPFIATQLAPIQNKMSQLGDIRKKWASQSGTGAVPNTPPNQTNAAPPGLLGRLGDMLKGASSPQPQQPPQSPAPQQQAPQQEVPGLPPPPAAAPQAAPSGRIVQRNKVTGKSRTSDDGGKTWQIQ